mmetsp:Transcript_29243/g.34796  ORF Transcript_29243/g.34796 Transcript_29243/m.34796 type:complete len:103 (-) Transcript_29243:991-1299(-)
MNIMQFASNKKFDKSRAPSAYYTEQKVFKESAAHAMIYFLIFVWLLDHVRIFTSVYRLSIHQQKIFVWVFDHVGILRIVNRLVATHQQHSLSKIFWKENSTC